MPEKIGNVLNYASQIEGNTLNQAHTLSKMPFIFGHVALMPDAHLGKGATVGSVIATEGAIIPAAVGVDIGCGMYAIETNLSQEDLPDDLNPILNAIGDAVPAGVGQGHETTANFAKIINRVPATRFDSKMLKRAGEQFGTLGSGNHFVEMSIDERGMVWIVLHSGSRGIGNLLARKHIRNAQDLMKLYHIQLEDRDLAYLVQDTPEFKEYMADLLWAQDYAFYNRERMMLNIIDQLQFHTPSLRAFHPGRHIQTHHNFTEMEHHWGRNVWVTRKGATRAREGELLVIPGSMGTDTYIGEGLGNSAAFQSAPHGAGRRMSRSQAKRELTVESLHEKMGDRTWLAGKDQALLDEHPDSYKDIHQVMEDSKDLVRPIHRLDAVVNYKGT